MARQEAVKGIHHNHEGGQSAATIPIQNRNSYQGHDPMLLDNDRMAHYQSMVEMKRNVSMKQLKKAQGKQMVAHHRRNLISDKNSDLP